MTYEPIVLVRHTTRRQARRSPLRRYAVPVAGATLLGGLLTVALVSRNRSTAIAVKRGSIVHSLVAIGRVESDRTIEIVPKISARIEAVHVEEGNVVEPGQLLVSLEESTLRAQRDEALRARDAAQARWDEVVRGARTEDLDRGKARVEEARQELARVETEFAEIQRGARPEEREEAEAQLALARAEAEYAAAERDRQEALFQDGVVSARERDEARRCHDAAQALARQAKARRDRVMNGAMAEEKARVQAGVEAARARLDQVKAAQARLLNGATEEERRSGEAELKRTQAVAARLESELAQTKLLSPIRGIVVRRYKEPSELAFPGMPKPILVLVESGERIVRIEVLQSDVYKIRVGQTAWITSESYPGRRWSGKAMKVASTMGKKALSTENPKEKTDVKVLEVRITPDEPMDLPLNLPVEARISETVRENVLVVPTAVLDDGASVLLADGSRRQVQTGARDDAFVEILSGLSEGEQVWIPE